MNTGYFFCFLVIAIVFSAAANMATNPHVPAGHKGYIYEEPRYYGKGGFKGIVIGPASYGMSVFKNKSINVDVRHLTYKEDFKILAKDDLNINFNFNVILRVNPESVKDVVEIYGSSNWYKQAVKEPFRHYVRQSVQKYKSSEIKSKRDEIIEFVKGRLIKYFEDKPFILVNLSVGNIDYPQIVATAVEKKLAAKQLLEEKDIEKKITEMDSEIRIIEAKGLAESQRIIGETLSGDYLQLEAIEAQKLMADSPNHTTVYIPVGTNGVPLVVGQGGHSNSSSRLNK